MAVSKQGESRPKDKVFARQWQHRSHVPIRVSPFFSWPLDGERMWRWVSQRWFALAENLLVLLISVISWQVFRPSQLLLRQLSWDWVLELYLRNLLLMTLVAGGLHLYFYVTKRQGQCLRFDTRPLVRGSRLFTFSKQVLDNMFWTLVSGVAVWTAFEVLMLWAMANGYAPILNWNEHPVWFVALFFLTPVWISLHFYWVHRWMHIPKVHALHHRNNNVGP